MLSTGTAAEARKWGTAVQLCRCPAGQQRASGRPATALHSGRRMNRHSVTAALKVGFFALSLNWGRLLGAAPAAGRASAEKVAQAYRRNA